MFCNSGLQFFFDASLFGYTVHLEGWGTNMNVLLLTSVVTTYLIGLAAEQITAPPSKKRRRKLRADERKS